MVGVGTVVRVEPPSGIRVLRRLPGLSLGVPRTAGLQPRWWSELGALWRGLFCGAEDTSHHACAFFPDIPSFSLGPSGQKVPF